ncbi:MAG: hypothetical protein ACSHXL_03690 [Bacteroidota bacterium]
MRTISYGEKLTAKSNPSKVYYNHFHAISYVIDSNSEKYDLKKIDYYNKLNILNERLDIENIRKLLWNSWSTEYAFLLTSQNENNDYHKFALHWHFPQIYYSVYLSMTAFHETQGLANEDHAKSIKVFGNSVKDNHYPKAISFFSNGLHNEFSYFGFDTNDEGSEKFSALAKIHSLEDAEIQVRNFLKTTRVQNAENKRKRGEKSLAKNPIFQKRDGQFTSKFGKKQWDFIYQTIPETTLLNILYRLRIKANYHNIEAFVNADIDFVKFHGFLSNILGYINFVHEAYIHKAIGDNNYQKILNEFGGHILEDRAKYRYESRIKKI